MRKVAGLVGAIAVLLALAAPVSAAPPEQSEDTSIFSIFPDPDNGIVVFWNISRDAYCDWEASDFDGPPPTDTAINTRLHFTPTGPIIFSYYGTAPLELWTLDEDADLTGPCQDTDDSSEPWATGSAQARYTDNDLDHPASLEAGLRRTNTFGERGEGKVVDGDGGTWTYGWHWRVNFDGNGDSREVVPGRGHLSGG
jgi:hypothetical protein